MPNVSVNMIMNNNVALGGEFYLF